MTLITIQSNFATPFSQAAPYGLLVSSSPVMFDTSDAAYDPVTVAKILAARLGKHETVPAGDKELLAWLNT
jgi:hypothetical protein